MKNRIWIRILVCMALVLLALGGIICAQAEPDFFFKEHLKLTGLYDGETLTRVTSVPAYSRPSDSILYRSGSVSAPVEVVGAVKNTSDNIWWVTADGRYVWSGLKWNGSAFVSADGDTDDYALYSSSNGSVRVPNFSHTLRLSASSIPKGTSATISGTITADTAVTNVRILLKGTTVSGSNYQ